MMRLQLAYALIVIGLVTAGCRPTIVDYAARTHVVQSGETLFSIAWRHGLDTRDLARWNRLENPNLIFVGQRLLLTSGSSRQASSAPASRAPQALPPQPTLPAPGWRWPVQGPLVNTYGAGQGTGNGIGIGGEVGQAIRAAAPGSVVYAGGGIPGYGQLLIIKHNDTYVSAYGHNNRLRVAEGETVSRGQIIAEMGQGPERRPQLHFEIRRNGAPVNPLGHLPR